MASDIAILGIFVADLAFTAPRLPVIGETILGQGFRMGPGGKGSNQSAAAAKAGGSVSFVTRVGRDAFAEIALKTWGEAGVDTRYVVTDEQRPTGAAFIFVSSQTGDNAIIVEAGAAGALNLDDVEAARPAITGAKIFLTQLEQPVPIAVAALAMARAAGVMTILNPAPAAPLGPDVFALCDIVTPNESEASLLTGRPVSNPAEAKWAAEALLAKGARAAVITLGENGALFHDGRDTIHVPAFRVGAVVDTTGAGDCFSGALAVALAEGRPPRDAIRFGCAAAAISVTRHGTAPAMPLRSEIEALLAKGPQT